uniref:Odorant receptor n=1 Tax=Holotrichia parallela TaxID=93412 RepID=A0A2P9JY50_HOLPA|nr:odorant receptor 10 [Holotrichia parallela]
MEVFHAAYVVKNFSNIGDAVGTGATVTTTMEGFVRVYVMVTKRQVINTILVKVWKQFWPLNVIEPTKRQQIQRKARLSVLLTSVLFFCSASSNSLITSTPYVRYHGMLLKSVFPFEWNQPFVYEIIYIWQYYSDWFVLFMINAFDFFFVSLVTVCFLQFVIIQDVVKFVLSERSRSQRNVIFGRGGESMSDREMLLKCLEQHKLINGICNELEECFNIAILIQFFVSTSALCAAALIMQVDFSQFFKMLTFAGAHLAQLFCYCYVGHQLSYESTCLAYAIYDCDWHTNYDRSIRKALVLMIQRSQKVQSLTAAGVTELNFTSFVRIMRLSFSFYTLLNNLLMKTESQ